MEKDQESGGFGYGISLGLNSRVAYGSGRDSLDEGEGSFDDRALTHGDDQNTEEAIRLIRIETKRSWEKSLVGERW